MPAPDLGTNDVIMSWISHTYSETLGKLCCTSGIMAGGWEAGVSPTNFCLLENFLLVGKFGAKNPPFREKFRGNLQLSENHNFLPLLLF